MARREINGEAVRTVRELLGIGQTELARRCGVTQSALSHVERGVYRASPALMRKLADELGVRLDAITSAVPEEVAS